MRSMFMNIVEKFDLSIEEEDVFSRIASIPYSSYYTLSRGNRMILKSLEQKGLIMAVREDRPEYILSPTMVGIKCFHDIIQYSNRYIIFILCRKKL
jgi:hypothetical protein